MSADASKRQKFPWPIPWPTTGENGGFWRTSTDGKRESVGWWKPRKNQGFPVFSRKRRGRGPSRIRTGDGGFAIHCLTAWLRGRKAIHPLQSARRGRHLSLTQIAAWHNSSPSSDVNNQSKHRPESARQ